MKQLTCSRELGKYSVKTKSIWQMMDCKSDMLAFSTASEQKQMTNHSFTHTHTDKLTGEYHNSWQYWFAHCPMHQWQGREMSHIRPWDLQRHFGQRLQLAWQRSIVGTGCWSWTTGRGRWWWMEWDGVRWGVRWDWKLERGQATRRWKRWRGNSQQKIHPCWVHFQAKQISQDIIIFQFIGS